MSPRPNPAVAARAAVAGMDEIAQEIGISKTVLVPRLGSAINEDIGEFQLTRMVISVHVQTVADEP